MASRVKEEEKNEKAIRALLRKEANRRCINCNSLGPQYVCLNFWTFVCTQCSGIHREFTHRVKSVSMSKFTSQEVENLENGGNERAREVYFKDWDPQRRPLPESSDVDRLRDFIRMVYVEKRLAGERTHGRGGEEEVREYRRPESRPPVYRGDSRSSYEERYDERPSGGRRSNAGSDRRFDEGGMPYEKRSPARFETDRNRNDRNNQDNRRFDDSGVTYNERRSPMRFESDHNRNDRNYQGNRRFDDRDTHYDEKRSPARFETDRNRNGRNYYENRDVDERWRNESRHSDVRYDKGVDKRYDDEFVAERSSRNYGSASPPPVRSVKEILGDDVPPLHVEIKKSQTNGSQETRKSYGSPEQDGQVQRTVSSSSSIGSADGSVSSVPAPVKREEPASLIDLSADPEPIPTSIHTSDASKSTDWASFDSAPGPAPSIPSVVPSILSLAVPTPLAQGGGFANQPPQANETAQWPGSSVSSGVQSTSDSLSHGFGQPSSEPWNAFGENSSTTNTATAAQTVIATEIPSLNTSVPGIAAPFGAANNSVMAEPWSSFPGNPSMTNSVPAAPIQTVQNVPSITESLPNISTSSGSSTNATSAKSMRSELPEELFAGGPQVNPQFAGFPPVRPHFLPVAGPNMMMGGYHQQLAPQQLPPQLQHPRSINPFDLPGDASGGPPVGSFPNLNSMQAALPNLNMQSMPSSGPLPGGYGPHLGSGNPMFPGGQVMYPPTVRVPSANAHFISEQVPNSSFPTMQSLGPRVPGPMQNPTPFIGMSTFQKGGPMSGVGGSPMIFNSGVQPGIGGPPTGSAMNSNLFFSHPQNSVPSVNGADSLFPLHGGQGAGTQSSLLGPSNGTTGNSNMFLGMGPVGSQNSFPPANGNPFG